MVPATPAAEYPQYRQQVPAGAGNDQPVAQYARDSRGERKARCLWIRRALVNQKQLDVAGIGRLIHYLPSWYTRVLSLFFLIFFAGLLRKTVYQLSYYS